MIPVKKSLEQLLGTGFMETVVQAAVKLNGIDEAEALRLATEEIDFNPAEYESKADGLLNFVGGQFITGMKDSLTGAPTESFRKASDLKASPVGGLGYTRLGEDGRLYLAAKSEHYHTPLGHNFPGYKLIDYARRLGITNATHNNTRGYITRLLETELVRTANGIKPEDKDKLAAVLDSKEAHVLNRVINLETGSLACEAAIKMMFARFYELDKTLPEPKYKDRIPVFFVMADNESGRKANYHGTTMIAQTFRDLWPGFYEKMEAAGILKVCPVRPNDFDDFEMKFGEYNKAPYKAAGFLHEIILMNYGGIRLDREYINKVYELCHSNDTPVMCDEIQSCMWYPGMYLFREYGLYPDFVIIGKGFPGGQYAASRIITTYEMDNLNQFGALVTNGQEELAALAYLITMSFAEANAEVVGQMGNYYEKQVRELAARYPGFISCVEGKGHLLAIYFHDAEKVLEFTHKLNAGCIDISSQTYKAKCPPAALTKPPVTATQKMLDYLVNKMEEVIKSMS